MKSPRPFVLLGQPVSHSLSPIFQNAGFAAAGLDAEYRALSCESADVTRLMLQIIADGGGGNITVPHKETAASIGVADSRVSKLGAANVFVGDRGTPMLGNTDVDGILHGLAKLNAPNSAWLVIGTGGSARAVAGAAAELGARLAVQSRSSQNRVRFEDWASRIGVVSTSSDECEVVINATPLGLNGNDPLPLDPKSFPKLRVALDLVYLKHEETSWVDRCRKRGIESISGREVLLMQGVASWKLWFPGVEPPVDAMRKALNAGLA